MDGRDLAVLGPVAEPGLAAAAAFDALYRREFAGVVALAQGLSGSRFVAEELAQEAFLAAHRHWDRIRTYDDPAAWVRRVALNRATSRLRRRAAERRALARLGARRPVVAVQLPAEDEQFWRAVRALPTKQTRAVALYYLEDRPLEEIGAILGCAPGTVKAHLHRGRRALAAALRCTLDEET